MSDSPTNEQTPLPAESENRRLFLKSLGKWSAAAIAAVTGTMIGTSPTANAGWINRRSSGGGGWINRRYGGGGSWINRRSGGGGGWINRRSPGSWINRRNSGSWINRRF
jgi:hypothetical protein